MMHGKIILNNLKGKKLLGDVDEQMANYFPDKLSLMLLKKIV